MNLQLSHETWAGFEAHLRAQPLHPGTCVGTCLLWNYEEVLQVLQEAGNVVATFSGHTHRVRTDTFGDSSSVMRLVDYSVCHAMDCSCEASKLTSRAVHARRIRLSL